MWKRSARRLPRCKQLAGPGGWRGVGGRLIFECFYRKVHFHSKKDQKTMQLCKKYVMVQEICIQTCKMQITKTIQKCNVATRGKPTKSAGIHPGAPKDTFRGGPERKGHTPARRRTLSVSGRNGRGKPRHTKDVLPLQAGTERGLGPNI